MGTAAVSTMTLGYFLSIAIVSLGTKQREWLFKLRNTVWFWCISLSNVGIGSVSRSLSFGKAGMASVEASFSGNSCWPIALAFHIDRTWKFWTLSWHLYVMIAVKNPKVAIIRSCHPSWHCCFCLTQSSFSWYLLKVASMVCCKMSDKEKLSPVPKFDIFQNYSI